MSLNWVFWHLHQYKQLEAAENWVLQQDWEVGWSFMGLVEAIGLRIPLKRPKDNFIDPDLLIKAPHLPRVFCISWFESQN